MLEFRGKKLIETVDILRANVIIGKYKKDLTGIVMRGWAQEREYFEKLPLKNQLAQAKRTRANKAYDYIIDEAKDWASQKKGIARLHNCNRMQVLIIEGSIVIRFKKMDRNGNTGNIVTEQVRRFNNQDIPEFEGMVMGSVGYVANDLNTRIDDILFTVIKGDTVLAHRSLYQSLFDDLGFDQEDNIEYITDHLEHGIQLEELSLVNIKGARGEKTEKKNE